MVSLSNKTNKKFDIKTTNNFLSNYKNEIIKYDQENIALTSKLSDLKTTLELNQSILLEYFSKTIGQNEEIIDLVNTIKTLWQENDQLLKEKNALDFKTFKLQETIEDTPTDIREELGIIQKENMKMKQMLIDKEAMLKKLTKTLDKARSTALFKVIKEEIMVIDPTVSNLQINNELIHTSMILNKVMMMNQSMMMKTEKIEKEVKMHKEELNAIRKDKENKRLEMLNILSSSPNRIRNTYNRAMPIASSTGHLPIKINNEAIEKTRLIMNTYFGLGVMNDKEGAEKSKSSSSSSECSGGQSQDSDISDTEGVSAKNKEKKLELLKKEYTQLKNEVNKNETKIEKIKVVYKDMKEKITSARGHCQTEKEKVLVLKGSPSEGYCRSRK